MKLRLVIALLVVLGLSACSQYTCPTYTKHDVEKKEIINSEDRI